MRNSNQSVIIKIAQPNSKWPPQKLIKPTPKLVLLEKSQFISSKFCKLELFNILKLELLTQFLASNNELFFLLLISRLELFYPPFSCCDRIYKYTGCVCTILNYGSTCPTFHGSTYPIEIPQDKMAAISFLTKNKCELVILIQD